MFVHEQEPIEQQKIRERLTRVRQELGDLAIEQIRRGGKLCESPVLLAWSRAMDALLDRYDELSGGSR